MSMFISKPIHPFLQIRAGNSHHSSRLLPSKDKVVVVMGATGTGKSRLSIDLATQFNGEVVNSDKMQVYEGLDVITNRITAEESCGVPHHLLGIMHPSADFTCTDFCNMASSAVASILDRQKLPIIAGGSNSYIEALIDNENSGFRSKYDCCYLWVDVLMTVLHQIISERADQMVEKGMVEEAREMFNPNAKYSTGIRRAIGVPEFDNYFRLEARVNEETRSKLLQEAIYEVKINSCKLACRQQDKILRLRNDKGWDIQRLDATDVFLKYGKESNKAWKELVLKPSKEIISRFLNSSGPKFYNSGTTLKAMATLTR
ncbi:Adenylate isopentenyltransferase 3, chloroplastic [Heracleum sosnowskyi]|uniref:adenylate dimethylallyltransferase (ADP/ATP-dependent) n=1 Tax=Heracleum sosnowskyi TaxID=360622 RepID=A0AAD8LXX3_9APIA|nr:Adenylate isopentenyltransferase 3, chloroplastic [Heracleum sosnowskyi]